jgi:hypothetical protein
LLKERTLPSNRAGVVERMRFRTTKLALFGPLVKVATLPAGRKVVRGSGRQSMTAVLLSTRTVSTVGVARS